MGISWGLGTRVQELFVIECYPAHFCHPRKIKKLSKSENKEMPDTRKKSKKRNHQQRQQQQQGKGRQRDETPTNCNLQKTKKSLVLEILSCSLFK